MIILLKNLGEIKQKFFVLLQLKIQNDLQEVIIEKNFLTCFVLLESRLNLCSNCLLILLIIHFLSDLGPYPIFNNSELNIFYHVVEDWFRFVWMLFLQNGLKKNQKRFLDMWLYSSELLITFILENFSKQLDLMIQWFEVGNSVDNG